MSLHIVFPRELMADQVTIGKVVGNATARQGGAEEVLSVSEVDVFAFGDEASVVGTGGL